MVPGVGEVVALHATLESERDNAEKGFAALTIILFALIPALGNVKKILRFWRWFRSVAKRGARKAASKATKVWSKAAFRDAFLAFAEEFTIQAITVGTGYGKWDPSDLAISTISGASSGAISTNESQIFQTWSEFANAMLTAFFKNNLPLEEHPGGIMEALAASLQVTKKAAMKATIMGVANGVIKTLLVRYGVANNLHAGILTTLDVLLGKIIDVTLDQLMTA